MASTLPRRFFLARYGSPYYGVPYESEVDPMLPSLRAVLTLRRLVALRLWVVTIAVAIVVVVPAVAP